MEYKISQRETIFKRIQLDGREDDATGHTFQKLQKYLERNFIHELSSATREKRSPIFRKLAEFDRPWWKVRDVCWLTRLWQITDYNSDFGKRK